MLSTCASFVADASPCGVKSDLDGIPRVSDVHRVADVVEMLARRCAWCSRVFTADGWAAVVGDDAPAAERETDTLCPDCALRLQQHRKRDETP